MAAKKTSSHNRRVAIVAGLRTPFVKSGTAFKRLSALDLGKAVVTELVARTGIDRTAIDRVVFGQVLPSIEAPNIAREIVLGCGLPHSTDGYSVSRACATGTQSIVDGAMAIMLGDADVVIAGGADSVSRPPITFQDGMVDALMAANAARSTKARLLAFSRVRPRDLLPKPPALKEQFTGLTMGQSAEVMAKLNDISRAEQDVFAKASHDNTHRAWENGILADEVMAVHVTGGSQSTVVDKDGIVRADTSLEKLAKLRPVFDRRHGTISAGNASPLTDGASAVLLMSEEKAKALGYEVLAFVESWGFAGIDPNYQLLQAPVLAAPIALAKANLQLSDLDVIDMHEAFAAQVLSNIKGLESEAFCREYAGLEGAAGVVDREKLNIYGGSISIGHPFAATGARQALTMARELKRRGGGTAMCTQCAAGGLGAALVLKL